MYEVNKPFQTKEGQFEEGERSIAVGVAVDALKGEGKFELKLKSDPEKIYYRDKKELKRFAQNNDSLWKSDNGTMTYIFPLKAFETRKNKKYQKQLV